MLSGCFNIAVAENALERFNGVKPDTGKQGETYLKIVKLQSKLLNCDNTYKVT